MKLGSFYLQMHALVTALIPTINDDYRAFDDQSDEPSMSLTVGADRKGWNYQTGDNQFTGGAYSYATWAVVILDRDSDPHDIAEDIIDQLDELSAESLFDPIGKRNTTMAVVRDTIRHPWAWPGGYPIYIYTTDGETMHPKCAGENYRRISTSTRNAARDGWAVDIVGVYWEGVPETCCHCNELCESAYGDPNVVELTAPSEWASYLINGDASGLEDDEQAACDEWFESVGLGDPIGCEDAGFCSHHDAWNVMPLAADCQTYTFLKKE